MEMFVIEMKKFFVLVAYVALLEACSKGDDGQKEQYVNDVKEETVNGVTFEMIYVKGGSFSMGSTMEHDTGPVHKVTLSDYYIGKFEVTQELWQAVIGTSVEQQRDKSNPRASLRGVGPDYPIYFVNWNDAQRFCQELSKKTGWKYTLPTEAQWEYAARGGVYQEQYLYSGSRDIDEVAWYRDNSDDSTHPVGMKKPNVLGIYDMSDNVEEWCSDWDAPYSRDEQTDPTGPAEKPDADGCYGRIVRGGDFSTNAGVGYDCWIAYRSGAGPEYAYSTSGFRVVCRP